MARPIWTGAISFGLVNVPVKLVSAQQPKDIRFNQLDGQDNTRISTRRVRPDDGEEVPYERLVKGYEVAPGQYVVITPEELGGLDPEQSRAIDIAEFVDLDDIDPLHYEKGYYLIPDKNAAKPYRLLVKALADAKKVAIARFVMRTKQYLASIRSDGKALILATMLYEDEVVSEETLKELPGDDIEVSDKELAIATSLIESLSEEADLSKYRDEHRDRVMELIEAKAAGEVFGAAPTEEKRAPVVDLMAALEASLAQAKKAAANKQKAG